MQCSLLKMGFHKDSAEKEQGSKQKAANEREKDQVALFEGSHADVVLPKILQDRLDMLSAEAEKSCIGEHITPRMVHVWDGLALGYSVSLVGSARTVLRNKRVVLVVDLSFSAPGEYDVDTQTQCDVVFVHIPVATQVTMRQSVILEFVTVVRVIVDMVRASAGIEPPPLVYLADRYGGGTAAMVAALVIAQLASVPIVCAAAYVTSCYVQRARIEGSRGTPRLLPDGEKPKKATDSIHALVMQRDIARLVHTGRNAGTALHERLHGCVMALPEARILNRGLIAGGVPLRWAAHCTSAQTQEAPRERKHWRDEDESPPRRRFCRRDLDDDLF